jgi:(5-formylfuran-3-yl)methyl phosphate synthase
MALLLVSVRSVAEAETALAGGADIIDIKEPSRGSLGRADDATILAIAERVGGKTGLSAALGELVETPTPPLPTFPGLVKIGLAGCASLADWRERLSPLSPLGRGVGGEGLSTRLVAVAYADWNRSAAPVPEDVVDFAVTASCAAFLIDTWKKDGRGLLNWLTMNELAAIRRRCAAAKLPLALAGSLTPADIERLLSLEPDIIAVRGAACRSGNRELGIDPAAVRRLRSVLRHRSSGRTE